MSLGIHQNCKAQMHSALKHCLQSIQVDYKTFLVTESTFPLLEHENLLRLPGDKMKMLVEIIDDYPFYSFVYQRLSKKLYYNKYNSESIGENLSAIEGFEDIDSVATTLVEEFDSLPWEYTLTIPLQSQISDALLPVFENNLKMCDDFHLVIKDDKYEIIYPSNDTRDDNYLPAGIRMLAENRASLASKKNAVCFQKTIKGFIGMYGNTNTVEIALESLKSFCGLAIALDLLKINNRHNSSIDNTTCFVNLQSAGKWVFEKKFEIERSFSEPFMSLELNITDNCTSASDIKKFFLTKLFRISIVLQDDKTSSRILRACQWLFDGNSGSNELLRFVQLTVVLEILFGDKAISDNIGLGNLLGNRCSYLIGKTHKQREKILEDFKKIYEIRSKVVHSGKTRFQFNERNLFYTLNSICKKSIEEETVMVINELKGMIGFLKINGGNSIEKEPSMAELKTKSL